MHYLLLMVFAYYCQILYQIKNSINVAGTAEKCK